MSGAFQVGAYQPAYQQDAVVTEQPSGGWTWFDSLYAREMQRRRAARKRREELEEESERIVEPTTREIALLLRKQEAETEKRAELNRLRDLARNLKRDEAENAYGERVAIALARAVEQGNYSALEAFDRELRRSKEEAEFMRLALKIIMDDYNS